jgi:hypothetical protein
VASHVLFGGLVVDEFENPVDTKIVGGEGFYVVDDDGFMRHIESEIVDRQVLEFMLEMIEDQEDLVSESTMRMIGQEDIFTKAAIEAELKNMGAQFEALLEQGLPEEVRAWMGMSGFRIVINRQGDVLRIDQPGMIEEPDE